MKLERRRGAGIVHGDRVLVPVSTVLRLGGRRGGLAWSCAGEIIVVDETGSRRIPVRDSTRRVALAALTAAGFIWTTWSRMAKPKRR